MSAHQFYNGSEYRTVTPTDPLPAGRSPLSAQSVTVATGAGTSSAEIDLGSASAFGIILPSDWTTSDITFKAASASGGTFVDVYNDSGTLLTIAAVAASRAYGFEANAGALFPWRYLKLVSVTSQGGTKTVTIVPKG